MRKRRLAPASALLLAALGVAPAYGQIPKSPAAPGSIEAGGGFGRFWGGSFAAGSTEAFDQKVLADDDVLKGLWVGAQVSRSWAVELDVRRTATHLLQPAGGVFPNEKILAGFDFATIEAVGLRTFRVGNFVPYAGLALGAANLDPDLPDPSVHDSTRACVAAVLGSKFYATPWIGVRFDIRGRATYLGKPRYGHTGLFASGRWFTNADFLFGAFVSFGGRSTGRMD
jgi:hypothetical protein